MMAITSKNRSRGLRLALAVALAASAARAGRAENAPTSPRPHERERIEVHTIGARPELVALGKGYIGVALVEITPELLEHFGVKADGGVLVSHVERDGPADKAGIRVGDILTRIDGSGVDSNLDVRTKIRGVDAGQTVDIELYRNGKPMKVAATVAERERSEIDLAPLFFKRRDGKDVLIELDPKQLPKDFEWTEGMPGGEVQKVIRLRVPEPQIENRLHELEKRIAELEALLEKKR